MVTSTALVSYGSRVALLRCTAPQYDYQGVQTVIYVHSLTAAVASGEVHQFCLIGMNVLEPGPESLQSRGRGV